MGNVLDLKKEMEAVSVKSDTSPDIIASIIANTIKEECSDLYGIPEADFETEIDDCRITLFIRKRIVQEKKDQFAEIDQNELEYLKMTGELDEKVRIPFDLTKLNRREIKHLNGILFHKLENIKKESLFQDYKGKEGSILNGIFLRNMGRNMIVSFSGVEGKLSLKEQCPGENYKQGDQVRCYIQSVELGVNNQIYINLSRRDARLVIRLFENEVQEMYDGIVKVKSIVRDAGRKTKVSVYSTQKEVEPVGTCVGLYGNRIKSVMKELKSERIDVIPYIDNIREYISRAIEPGRVTKVLLINEQNKEALVVVEDESYPLAIGREGVNVKLASELVGWDLSVRTESQMKKRPEILKVFSKIDSLFKNDESDLIQLTDIEEEILVKLMNAGILSIEELYEKTLNELKEIEGVSEEEALKIRKTLDDKVELVDSEDELEQSYQEEVEDEIKEIDSTKDMQEEVQQIEFMVCPSCEFEFEYSGTNQCPSCGIEFELE